MCGLGIAESIDDYVGDKTVTVMSFTNFKQVVYQRDPTKFDDWDIIMGSILWEWCVFT